MSTAEYRSQINRANALSRVAKEGGTAVSAPGRAAFLETFRTQVDPEHKLEAAERERRARFAMRAHFTRLAAKSAKVRKANAANRSAKAAADELRALADEIERAA